jgi:prepilin peptidase dependent protein B
MLNPRSRRRRARGASIIELMVGVTVGLVVVGAAITLSGRNIASSRVLLADIRVNQDLRAVAELMTRDLRRAAYWGHAIDGTRAAGSGSVAPRNPYGAVTATGGSSVTYAFTRDSTEDDTLGSGEQFGFRLQDGRIEMQTAQGSWQPVTDPEVITVTTLAITPNDTVLPLGHLCPTPCALGAPNCPTVTVRRFELLLRGASARDADAVRELRSTVRVRNDQFNGQCPA